MASYLCDQLSVAMAFHRPAGSICLLLALMCVLLSSGWVSVQAKDKTTYAAIVERGQKGRWPYCAVTGWKPAIFPCPPKTTCKMSWIDRGRTASNCYKTSPLTRCSLKYCAWAGADAICRLRVFRPKRITCGAYAKISPCGPPFCHKIYQPVCDSYGKKWGNLCVLTKGLCQEGFAKAYGPILGNC